MSVWQIAIETSGRQGSVALLRQDVSITEIVLDSQARTAQTIGPAIEKLIKTLDSEEHPLSFVSVVQGPGSFTGLRIGITAAKALAFTRNCPVVACDTLALMIQQVRSQHPIFTHGRFATGPSVNGTILIDAAINAYRGQVFCRRESSDGNCLLDSHACDTQAWLHDLVAAAGSAKNNDDHESQPSILATGDAWNQRPAIHPNLEIVPQHIWQPMASELGKMAWQKFLQSQTQDCLTLVPDYLRESAAVEKKKSEKKNSEKKNIKNEQ